MNSLNKKYLISSDGMFRYFCERNFDKLTSLKLMYLDHVYEEVDESVQNMTNPFPNVFPLTPQLSSSTSGTIKQVGLKVFEKVMKKEDFKKINIKDINIFYDDLINFYYDNSFNSKENAIDDEDFNKRNIIMEVDLKEDNSSGIVDRKIISKMFNVSNLCAMKGRVGPANVCILPEKIYNRIGNQTANMKSIKNTTNFHHDKIFVIRVSDELSQPGISVMTDNYLSECRELKLIRIMNRINKVSEEDKFMNYYIFGNGSTFKYHVGVIYLNE